jgi:hypothetical protein
MTKSRKTVVTVLFTVKAGRQPVSRFGLEISDFDR